MSDPLQHAFVRGGRYEPEGHLVRAELDLREHVGDSEIHESPLASALQADSPGVRRDLDRSGASCAERLSQVEELGRTIRRIAPLPIAKAPEDAGPREGSKTAKVVAMLQRKNGATLVEIMQTMGWLRHTVRGFMAGAMKKAGYNVESFKPEGGERTYRISK